MKHLKLPAFSLIETLLYSALVATIIGFVTLFMWQMVTSHARDREAQTVVENSLFVTQKIGGLLYGTSASLVLPASGTASQLEIQKSGTNHVVIDLQDGVIRLGRDTNGDGSVNANDSHWDLTNSHVTAGDILFERTTHNGTPVIHFTATLQGQYTNRTIDTTFYLL